MKFHFYKMHGCGNDFVFLDSMEKEIPNLSRAQAIAICDRHFGVGADGLVVLRSSAVAQAGWEFYNCDGSSAEMCGNAARCAIQFLSERYFTDQKEEITLETGAGIIRGRKDADGLMAVTLLAGRKDGFEYGEKTLQARTSVGDEVVTFYTINTGVPHAVVEVRDLATYPIDRIGKAFVAHAAFPEGSNITFFQRLSGKRILSTTFERGVEAETYACGTGVVAAAIIFSERYLEPFPIEVTVPGGALVVEKCDSSGDILLKGPASWVFEGDISLPGHVDLHRRFGERKRKS